MKLQREKKAVSTYKHYKKKLLNIHQGRSINKQTRNENNTIFNKTRQTKKTIKYNIIKKHNNSFPL